MLVLDVTQLACEVQPCSRVPPCSAQLGVLQAGACVCPANGSTLCVPPDVAGGDLGFVAAQLGLSFDASSAFQVSQDQPVMQTCLQLLWWYNIMLPADVPCWLPAAADMLSALSSCCC